jgi:hypothetical protein
MSWTKKIIPSVSVVRGKSLIVREARVKTCKTVCMWTFHKHSTMLLKKPLKQGVSRCGREHGLSLECHAPGIPVSLLSFLGEKLLSIPAFPAFFDY